MGLGTFLNGAPPVRLRGLLWLALSDVGQVGTLTSTDDSGGGASQSWVFGDDVPCRVDPIASGHENEAVIAGRLDDRSTHLVTVPAGTTVTHNQRFRITGGATFEVTAVRDRTGEWARVFEAVEVS